MSFFIYFCFREKFQKVPYIYESHNLSFEGQGCYKNVAENTQKVCSSEIKFAFVIHSQEFQEKGEKSEGKNYVARRIRTCDLIRTMT